MIKPVLIYMEVSDGKVDNFNIICAQSLGSEELLDIGKSTIEFIRSQGLDPEKPSTCPKG